MFPDAVGQCRRRWFVDDAFHLDTGDLARILSGLTLGIVKIRRNGNDGFGNIFTEIVFGGFPHLLEYGRGYLRRRVGLAFDVHLHRVAGPLLHIVRNHC